jgi:hypothetical protein
MGQRSAEAFGPETRFASEIPQEWVDAAMDAAAGKHLNEGEEFHGDDLDFEAAVAAVVPLIHKSVIAEVEEALTAEEAECKGISLINGYDRVEVREARAALSSLGVIRRKLATLKGGTDV